jgi:repressor LexA
MNRERASKKQQELLSFVDGFIKGNGYGPSYREIMKALGYKSVSTVAIHIDGLIAKGYLARRDKSARSLEVVTLRHDAVPAPETAPTETVVLTELKKRVQQADLNDAQTESVRTALALLGFEEAVPAVSKEENDGPTA